MWNAFRDQSDTRGRVHGANHRCANRVHVDRPLCAVGASAAAATATAEANSRNSRTPRRLSTRGGSITAAAMALAGDVMRYASIVSSSVRDLTLLCWELVGLGDGAVSYRAFTGMDGACAADRSHARPDTHFAPHPKPKRPPGGC